MASKQSERGAITGFIIIGAVLAVLLVAGLYFSKQQARNEATGTTDTTAQTDTSASSSGDTTPTTPSNTHSSTSTTLPADSSASTSTRPSSAIASTGPKEVVFTLVGLTLLAAALASYFQSSRRFVRAAHQ